jgi:hypothetical protein
VVGYFNGVNNTFAVAQSSLERLRTRVIGTEYRKQPVSYQLFYNPTQGLERDLAETFKQKEIETPEIQGRWELFWDTAQAVSLLGPDWGEFLIAAERIRLEKFIREANPELIVQPMAERIIQLVDERKNVLGVGHSQGTLFVNAVFNLLDPILPKDHFNVVDVAPASAFVGPSARTPYTLANIDLIINPLRFFFGFIPEPNINIDTAARSGDHTGHGFLEIYMNSLYPAFYKISADIDTQLQALVDPTLCHTLTLNKPKTGTVTSAPAGLDCGDSCAFSQTDFQPGALIKLTATPPPGFVYTQWEGLPEERCKGNDATVEIILDQDITCTVSFRQPTLTVTKNNFKGGSLIAGPTSCPIDCVYTVFLPLAIFGFK